MKTRILFLAAAFVCSVSFTKAQLIEYAFGNPSVDQATFSQVYDAADNALVHIGYDNSGDALIVKTTPNGSAVIWKRKLPGSAAFFSVIIAAYTPPGTSGVSTGDYIVVGEINGALTAGGQALICRYSHNGTLLYSQAVTDGSWQLLFTGVCELQNGNITAVGYEGNNPSFPSTTNAFIETFDPKLVPLPGWCHSLSNSSYSGALKSMFISTVCDATTIYVVGNTDNPPHTGYEGVVTRFDYLGNILNAQYYDVSYPDPDAPGTILNTLWFLQPVLMSNHLYIWAGIENWTSPGNDAGVVDIDNTTFTANYTSVHANAYSYTNPQGLGFHCYAPGDYLFTIAPGTSEFVWSLPTSTPYPPAIVRLTGGSLNYAKRINDPANDYSLFSLYVDGSNNVYAGGFKDNGPGTQKNMFALEAKTGIYSGQCPLDSPSLTLGNPPAPESVLTWYVTQPPVTYTNPTDDTISIARQLVCGAACPDPCPHLTILNISGQYGDWCTLNDTIIVTDSNTCWKPVSYQWSLDGTTVTNYSTIFTNTQTMTILYGHSGYLEIVISFVDPYGDTCRHKVIEGPVTCANGTVTYRYGGNGQNATTAAPEENIDIFPNPALGTSSLSIAVSEPSHIDIKLTNSIGQDVSTVIGKYEKAVQAGSYNVTIASDILPAGVYYCTVTLNGKPATKKLVVY